MILFGGSMLDDMLLFVTVIEEKSFSKAAIKLGITKSVVSKRISRLESKIRSQLIRRTTRHLSLTELGQDFYKRCVQIQRDVTEAIAAINYKQREPNGILRLNAPANFSRFYLMPIIQDFIKKYPQVNINCVFDQQRATTYSNEFDLIITIAQNLPDSSFQARRLATSKLCLCGSPEYFAKHGKPKNPEDLYQHNCLVYLQQNKPLDEWVFYDKKKQEKRIKIESNFYINSSTGLAHAAFYGLGLIMLPKYILAPTIDAGKLVTVLDEYQTAEFGIYALYPNNRYVTPKVRLFIDILADRLSKEEQNWF